LQGGGTIYLSFPFSRLASAYIISSFYVSSFKRDDKTTKNGRTIWSRVLEFGVSAVVIDLQFCNFELTSGGLKYIFIVV
jgi:hypothetical protein